jgi:hypothetical protein
MLWSIALRVLTEPVASPGQLPRPPPEVLHDVRPGVSSDEIIDAAALCAEATGRGRPLEPTGHQPGELTAKERHV